MRARTNPRSAPAATDAPTMASTNRSNTVIRGFRRSGLRSEFLAGEQPVGFEVAVGRGGGDLGRERRRGRPLVPVERFEVVAHELLVEGGLRVPRLVGLRRPEA